MLNAQETDNPVLFVLLFFLNLDNEPRQYDVDAPIGEIDWPAPELCANDKLVIFDYQALATW